MTRTALELLLTAGPACTPTSERSGTGVTPMDEALSAAHTRRAAGAVASESSSSRSALEQLEPPLSRIGTRRNAIE
eukprot:1981606-Prymnesium_polylepis.1